MFCTKCGKEVVGDGKFCANCGQPIDLEHRNETFCAAELPKQARTAPFPQIGESISVFRKAKALFPKYKVAPKVPLDWLYGTTDVIFTESYFVVLTATPQTALKEFSDKMTDRLPAGLALVGGPVGAVLGGALSASLFAAGGISEKLFGKKDSIELEALAQLFTCGHAIYARKEDLNFKLFNLKKPIFYYYHEVYANGLFHWLDQTIDLSLRFNDEAHNGIIVKKHFERGHCRLVENTKKMSELDSYKLALAEYPVVVPKHEVP